MREAEQTVQPGHTTACARALPCLLPGERQQHLHGKKQTPTHPLLLLFSSSDEPRQLLPIKVSRSLEQALEKLSLSPNNKEPKGDCAGSDELTAISRSFLPSLEQGLQGGLGACCVSLSKAVLSLQGRRLPR